RGDPPLARPDRRAAPVRAGLPPQPAAGPVLALRGLRRDALRGPATGCAPVHQPCHAGGLTVDDNFDEVDEVDGNSSSIAVNADQVRDEVKKLFEHIERAKNTDYVSLHRWAATGGLKTLRRLRLIDREEEDRLFDLMVDAAKDRVKTLRKQRRAAAANSKEN